MFIDLKFLGILGGALTTIGIILGAILKVHKWYIKQCQQDEEIKEIKTHHEADVHRLKEENCLMCYALSACLDGLQQLGANHTVPLAKEKLDKYLNQQAHE